MSRNWCKFAVFKVAVERNITNRYFFLYIPLSLGTATPFGGGSFFFIWFNETQWSALAIATCHKYSEINNLDKLEFSNKTTVNLCFV